MYDIIIVGGGPAGLTAAVYGLRAGKTVLVLEKETVGGQITFSPCVENIPGFTSLSGSEFADRLVDQAMGQGAEVELAEVTSIEDCGDHKKVVCDDGLETYEGRAVILATGAKHRHLGLEHEEDLIGNGISFCAVCDGAFYAGKTVGMVGGGNSALVEAVMLADLVKELYIFQDLDMLTGEAKLQEQLAAKENVRIITGVRVEKVLGENELTGIVVSKKDGTQENYALDGLFVAIGVVPQNEAFKELVETDRTGYIVSGENMKTRTPGIFAAGDCRTKRIRQVATAASDGAVAALMAVSWIEGRD